MLLKQIIYTLIFYIALSKISWFSVCAKTFCIGQKILLGLGAIEGKLGVN